MLQTSSTKSVEPKKRRVGVGDGSRAGRNESEIDSIEVHGSEVEDD